LAAGLWWWCWSFQGGDWKRPASVGPAADGAGVTARSLAVTYCWVCCCLNTGALLLLLLLRSALFARLCTAASGRAGSAVGSHGDASPWLPSWMLCCVVYTALIVSRHASHCCRLEARRVPPSRVIGWVEAWAFVPVSADRGSKWGAAAANKGDCGSCRQ